MLSSVKDRRMCVSVCLCVYVCVLEPRIPTGAEMRLSVTGVEVTCSAGGLRCDIAPCARQASNPHFFAWPHLNILLTPRRETPQA